MLLLRAGLRDMGFSSSSSASASAEPAGAKRDLAFDLLCTHQSLIHTVEKESCLSASHSSYASTRQ